VAGGYSVSTRWTRHHSKGCVWPPAGGAEPSRRKGGGADFEPMTCSGGVLCYRASHLCCTEATSELNCNPSPRLFGSVWSIYYQLWCGKCILFSDYGITLVPYSDA
jgi:hypothetical protein